MVRIVWIHHPLYAKRLRLVDFWRGCDGHWAVIELPDGSHARGAEVGDIFMSLIHTAELCRASPFDYLCAIMTNAERVIACPSQWLPWNYKLALAPSA